MKNKNWKIRNLSKVLAIILLFSIIITNSACSSNSERKQVLKYSTLSTEIMSLLSNLIQTDMEKVDILASEIAFSDLVQNGLNTYTNMNDNDKYDFNKKLKNIVFSKSVSIPEMFDFKIVSNNGNVIYSNGNSEIDAEDLKSILKNATNKKGLSSWTLSNSESNKNIILSKSVLNIKSGEQKAVIIIELKESFISKIYKNVNTGEKSDIFIINADGVVVSSINKEIEVGKKYKDEGLISKIIESNGNSGFVNSINGEKYIIVYSNIKSNSWYIVSTIPYNTIVK